MRDITIDMAEGMNVIFENYNDLISIEEKIINLQKDINDIRSKSYISQNLLEKCFERLGEMIMRTDDVSSVPCPYPRLGLGLLHLLFGH